MEYKIFANRGKVIEKTEPCNLLPWEERTLEEIAAGISKRYKTMVVIEITICDRW